MQIEDAARQIHDLVCYWAGQGKVLPVSFEVILQSLLDNSGFFIEVDMTVVSYAAVYESTKYLKIGTVVVDPRFTRKGYGEQAVRGAVDLAQKRNQKPIVAITNGNSSPIFRKLGFTVQPKEDANKELWGGRTREEWLSSDREFFRLDSQ